LCCRCSITSSPEREGCNRQQDNRCAWPVVTSEASNSPFGPQRFTQGLPACSHTFTWGLLDGRTLQTWRVYLFSSPC
jgi:hypothetical protein